MKTKIPIKKLKSSNLGGRDSSYDEFLNDIMSCGPEDCRYGLFDFEYQHQCQGTSEKTMKEKLLLMSWCPDTARIKKKMLYSSSFDALKKCLVGVQKYIQVSQMSNQKKSSILNNDHILGPLLPLLKSLFFQSPSFVVFESCSILKAAESSTAARKDA